METDELSQYVAGRVRAGAHKAAILEELISLGWTEDEAANAFRSGIIQLGAPLPSEGSRPKNATQAATVDIVINFFSFILLGIVATALGTLFFQVINLSFPDPLTFDTASSFSTATSAVHYSIAALLIGFPLYYFALRLWFQKFREDEGRTESKLSKWLTYLVLLVTAVTIVGDLITTVFTLLQGEITIRFLLKALTILFVAGAIFGFYYLERRKIQYRAEVPRSIFQWFGRSMAGVIGIAVVLGFWIGGSPTTERNRSLDLTRSNNLATLASCVEQYAGNLGALPESIDQLTHSNQYGYCASVVQDPETKIPYEYRVVVARRTQGASQVGEYELCANFSLSTRERASSPQGRFSGENQVWYEHDTGRVCTTVSAKLSLSGSTVPMIPVIDGKTYE